MARHQAPRATRKNTSACRLTGQLLSFSALIITALAAIVLIVVPLLTGSQTYSVLTSSMKPNYAPGTLLVVKPSSFSGLNVGDVVTYQIDSGRPEVITHRVLSVGADQEGNRTLITKGDNNALADESPVSEVQVRGKLMYAVPYVGFVANWLGNQDRGMFSQLAAGGLILYGIGTMANTVITRRKGSKQTKETEPTSMELAA